MPSRLSPQADHEKLLYIPIVSAGPLRVFIRLICHEKQWANLSNLGGIRYSSQLVQLVHTT